MTGPTNPRPVDWATIGRRMSDAAAHFVHHSEERLLYGDDFHIAVIKRALGAARSNRLTYETVSPSLGLVTMAEHEWTVEGHGVMERLRAEAAERKVAELQEEVRRIRRDAWRDAVTLLRELCNERRIPARLRREGWLMAADQLDPDIARDRFGDPVKQREAS